MFDARLRNPSTFIVSGPSQSGKTSLVLDLIINGGQLFEDSRCLQKIYYFYKQWQPKYDQMSKSSLNVEFIQRLPNVAQIRELANVYSAIGGCIMVLDDFMQEVSKDISVLFSALSHHMNITTFLLTQNLFYRNPVFRDISLNATYVILFKNPRDASQISTFARQYRPGRNNFITQVYRDVTKLPHSYILFDNHQATPDIIRIRSNLLARDTPLTVWVEDECF